MRLAIVILAYNRRDALRRTLTELRAQGWLDRAAILVADNASTDGTSAMLAAEFPAVRAITMPGNLGIEAFNRAADIARLEHAADLILILDDDAWPAPGALDRALALLQNNPALAAVALAPVHPRTSRPEWPRLTRATDHWPFMGCANLIRTPDWHAAGGYETAFFLYRNDTDLALTLLAAGRGVHADPALTAFHDSPAAATKSDRWLQLATRNWCWMCRRHGRGLQTPVAIALGSVWALIQAGLSPRRITLVVRGLAKGVASPTPPLPPSVRPDHLGPPLTSLLRIQLQRRRNQRMPKPAAPGAAANTPSV